MAVGFPPQLGDPGIQTELHIKPSDPGRGSVRVGQNLNPPVSLEVEIVTDIGDISLV